MAKARNAAPARLRAFNAGLVQTVSVPQLSRAPMPSSAQTRAIQRLAPAALLLPSSGVGSDHGAVPTSRVGTDTTGSSPGGGGRDGHSRSRCRGRAGAEATVTEEWHCAALRWATRVSGPLARSEAALRCTPDLQAPGAAFVESLTCCVCEWATSRLHLLA